MSPSRGKGSKKPTRLTGFILLALCFTIQVFLWHGKNRLKHLIDAQEHLVAVAVGSEPRVTAWKRSVAVEGGVGVMVDSSEVDESGGTLLGLDYWDWYSSAKSGGKPLIFATLVLW